MEDLRDAKSADFIYEVENVLFLFYGNSDYVVLMRSWAKMVRINRYSVN